LSNEEFLEKMRRSLEIERREEGLRERCERTKRDFLIFRSSE